MEPGRGSGVVKPINVDPEDVGLNDTDNSELSISIASNSMLSQLEATDAEKAQNEEERRRRRASEKRKEKDERRWITQFGDGDDVHGLTTTIQGCCTLATDTPPPMAIMILWSTINQTTRVIPASN